MCSSLQTHVIFISSLCLLLTGFLVIFKEIFFISHPNERVAGIGSVILIWDVFAMTSQILSIVGSRKNNKCLLIPFIISLVLQLLWYIGLCICYGTLIRHAHDVAAVATMFMSSVLGFGLTTYFLVIVVQFYNALLSRASLQPEIELQPYTRPAGGEYSTV